MGALLDGQRARIARRFEGRRSADDVSDLAHFRGVKVGPAVEQVLRAQNTSTGRFRPDAKVGSRADVLPSYLSIASWSVTHVGDRRKLR